MARVDIIVYWGVTRLGGENFQTRSNPYEGVYAAARPCNGKELGRSLRYTHAKAVGRVRP